MQSRSSRAENQKPETRQLSGFSNHLFKTFSYPDLDEGLSRHAQTFCFLIHQLDHPQKIYVGDISMATAFIFALERLSLFQKGSRASLPLPSPTKITAPVSISKTTERSIPLFRLMEKMTAPPAYWYQILTWGELTWKTEPDGMTGFLSTDDRSDRGQRIGRPGGGALLRTYTHNTS